MESVDISLLIGGGVLFVNLVTLIGGLFFIGKMLTGPIDKRIDGLDKRIEKLETGQVHLKTGQAKLETELKNIKELIQTALSQNKKN